MRRKIVVGLIIAFVATWAWIALRPGPEERLAALIAELRAQGEPVSLAEMERPMPPDDQNGAHDLDAAMAWFEANEPEGVWESRIAGPWNHTVEFPYQENSSPEQMAALDDFLVFLAPLFEQVDRGVDKPEIAWPLPARDTAAGVSELCVRVRLVQTLQRFLAARAISGGAEPERRRAIRSTLALGARLRSRMTIDHLMAATGYTSGCQLLCDALATGRVDPAAARDSLDDVLRVAWDPRFPELVRGERAHQLDSVPFWLDGSMADALRFGPPPSAGERFLRGLKGLLKGRVDFDTPESPDVMIDLTRGLDRFLDPALSAQATYELDCSEDLDPLTMLLPRVRQKLAHADALSRLARLSLAAYAHRRLHGAWPTAPATLAPLFPEGVPGDPYTGAAFVMERDGDDLVLRAQPWDGIVEEGDEPAEYGFVWRLPPR